MPRRRSAVSTNMSPATTTSASRCGSYSRSNCGHGAISTRRRAKRADAMLLRALLFFQIFYTVYELHFQFPTGIPGINVVNLIFLLALGAILLSKPDVVRTKPVLRGAILLFFLVLMLAFFNAQSTKPPAESDDVTYLKTAIFYPLLYFMYL